jgi:transposase
MNFSLGTIAFWYDYSKTIPERRSRRRVGLCRPVSGAPPRGRPPTRPRPQRGVQRAAVGDSHRLTVALHAPRDLPPWQAVYQQTQRWLKAGVFEQMVHDLRMLLRLSEGRASDPTATILDSRTLRCTPESGSRGGYDGAKRKKGSKVHAAVDTLGNLLALRVSPASESRTGSRSRNWPGPRARSHERVGRGGLYVDQGYTGERAAKEAAAHGMRLEVVKHSETKRGFVLLPRRWVVERDFAWASRFRRLVKDYERLSTTLAGLHFVAFACLFLQQAAGFLSVGS